MAGRITVKTNADSVELDLHWWALKPTATLAKDEVAELIRRLEAASAKVWPRKGTTVSDDDDDYSDIA